MSDTVTRYAALPDIAMRSGGACQIQFSGKLINAVCLIALKGASVIDMVLVPTASALREVIPNENKIMLFSSLFY
ncbi:hypothetical protein [Pseudoalteromonas aurantia]|uniref:Uncharacterized protein n=1 Tax=Pseudoalteromonas aurantia 208 TaxID=1314867 RepID=A0ABR9E8I0_9GAMM|nr:hypothetical protein [Pseudoalteromonas aurantia]MBE0367302.1 hypothetical protein [Pseudoalteromonas aurantia 208]